MLLFEIQNHKNSQFVSCCIFIPSLECMYYNTKVNVGVGVCMCVWLCVCVRMRMLSIHSLNCRHCLIVCNNVYNWRKANDKIVLLCMHIVPLIAHCCVIHIENGNAMLIGGLNVAVTKYKTFFFLFLFYKIKLYNVI